MSRSVAYRTYTLVNEPSTQQPVNHAMRSEHTEPGDEDDGEEGEEGAPP